ncbi:MAG TPA: histidine kinase dimerization/phosphoacceptor domain -containing protein [Polyangiales bacterium]|nr:histidine kinase dimerization/phosphoacceptor domain -containing protein [Polyangiales bacterium]
MPDSAAPVLIVEDERIVARDLQRTLLGFGYDAFAIAASCEEAISRASEKCPAVVLMDIRIKGDLDGIATARILRERFATAVVYLTSHADPDTLQRATATEPSGYLQKPVRPAELRSAIEISLHKRQSEARWREGERWIDAALSAIPEAVIAVHTNGRILELNNTAAIWFGRSPSELRGTPLRDVLRMTDTQTGAQLEDPVGEVIREMREYSGHALFWQGDASQRAVKYRVRPVYALDAARPLGALLVMGEPGPAAHGSDFRALVDGAPVGMFVHRDGRFVYSNAAFAGALGYSSDELLGVPVLETVEPEARAELVERMRRVSSGVPGTTNVVRSLRRDGGVVFLEGTGFPLSFDGGAATGVVMQDITLKQRLHSQLEDQEARYRHLFRDSPISLWEEDFSEVRSFLEGLRLEGKDVPTQLREQPQLVVEAASRIRLVDVNDATLAMYRAGSREELQANLREVFLPEGFPLFCELLCFLWEGKGGTFAAQGVTRTLRGERNEVDLRASVLPGAERSWSRVVLSLSDTTALKGVEAELRRSLREQDVLLREVQHRVKNNLQVICSLLSLQSSHLSDDGQRGVFLESQNRVQAIALVHEQLYRQKQLSHIPFGEYTEALVTDLVHTHRASERGITVRVHMPDVRLGVDAAIPCGLIVTELVSNSLKHAFPGHRGGKLDVALESRAGKLLLSVRDDGIGLPPGFDPRRTTSLGLDLVFTFAEQLEAEVTVDTSAGTCFRIAFGEK